MCECCVFVVVGSFFSIQLCVAISCAEQLTLSQDIILKLIFLFVCRPFFTFFCLQCIWFSLNRPLKQLVYCSAWEITNPPLFISLILFIQPIYVPFLSLAITRSGGSYLATHWTLKKEPTSIDSVVIFNYHFFASIFICIQRLVAPHLCVRACDMVHRFLFEQQILCWWLSMKTFSTFVNRQALMCAHFNGSTK